MGLIKKLFSDITISWWETKLIAWMGIALATAILLQWPVVVEKLTDFAIAFWVFAAASWLYIMGIWVKRVLLK